MNKEYQGHKIVIRNGYQAIYKPKHHLAYADGMVYLHNYIAEEILGRNLKPEERVHHIDLNKQNNTKSNLMIFATETDHLRFHSMLRNEKNYVLIRIKMVYQCVEYIKDDFDVVTFSDYVRDRKFTRICPKCGGSMSYGAKLCKQCSLKYHKRNGVEVQIPRKKSIISVLHKYKNFVKAGEYFGVTDNAVRKWCKKYNIPSHSSIIKKMTEDEWKRL